MCGKLSLDTESENVRDEYRNVVQVKAASTWHKWTWEVSKEMPPVEWGRQVAEHKGLQGQVMRMMWAESGRDFLPLSWEWQGFPPVNVPSQSPGSKGLPLAYSKRESRSVNPIQMMRSLVGGVTCGSLRGRSHWCSLGGLWNLVLQGHFNSLPGGTPKISHRISELKRPHFQL